ncbi:MAG: hypothetical protein AAGA62_00755 [Bacteroidota bacterium]
MDLYVDDIKKHYLAVKEFEWNHDRLTLLTNLAGLNWATDRLYLFCKLRLYARFLDYRKLFHQREIGLYKEDFSALKVLAQQERGRIKSEDSLWAYLRTTEVLNMDVTAENTPALLDDHLSFLESKVQKLDQEDYVDCVTYLLNYALQAVNRGHNQYDQPLFRAAVLVINRKYGESWKTKHQRLNDKIFTLVVVSALTLQDRRNWSESLIYGITPLPDKTFTVFDWVDQYLKVYSSRLKKEVRKATLNYSKLRVAFHREAYDEVAGFLSKLADQDLKFYGHVLRIITLIAYYELRYCYGDKAHPGIRKYQFDVNDTLSKLKMNLRDLKDRQERLPLLQQHLEYFITGYENLLDIREQIDLLPKGSRQRQEKIRQLRLAALEQLVGFDHKNGDWLRNCLNELY